MEIEKTAHPLETNAHANFPMADNAAYQCMENGGGKHAHIDMFVSHCACRVQCWEKVKDLDGSLENMLNVFSVLLIKRRWATVPLMGAINAHLPYNCTKRSPPDFSGSYMSYVSLVDVRKTWELTATLNGRVHIVWRSLSVPFLIYKPKGAFFLYM